MTNWKWLDDIESRNNQLGPNDISEFNQTHQDILKLANCLKLSAEALSRLRDNNILPEPYKLMVENVLGYIQK